MNDVLLRNGGWHVLQNDHRPDGPNARRQSAHASTRARACGERLGLTIPSLGIGIAVEAHNILFGRGQHR